MHSNDRVLEPVPFTIPHPASHTGSNTQPTGMVVFRRQMLYVDGGFEFSEAVTSTISCVLPNDNKERSPPFYKRGSDLFAQGHVRETWIPAGPWASPSCKMEITSLTRSKGVHVCKISSTEPCIKSAQSTLAPPRSPICDSWHRILSKPHATTSRYPLTNCVDRWVAKNCVLVITMWF